MNYNAPMYTYITENNLLEENRQTYMYSEYGGEEFLEAYKASRIFSVGGNTNPGASENSSSSRRLALLKQSAVKGELTDEAVFSTDKLVQSFEVRKRIYNECDELWKPLDKQGKYDDTESYILFGEILSIMYEKTKVLKYLSCLLKLDDTLLSVSGLLNRGQSERLSCLLKKELTAVEGLEETRRILRSEVMLDDIALIAADTTRSKAYIQALTGVGMLPSKCLILTDNKSKMLSEAECFCEKTDSEYFSHTEPLIYTLSKYNIPYEFIETKDINSEEAINKIRNLTQKHLIYSGYGGVILKPELFKLNKKYLHVHAGILPMYRGSTTAYYSMLDNNEIGATSIFLNEKIDEGELLCQQIFEIPADNVDIDYIYEPWIRAKVLVKTIRKYIQNNYSFKSFSQTGAERFKEETYFIIHPVLKHIALIYR